MRRLLPVLLLALAGCATAGPTPYQPFGRAGGYVDRREAKGVYVVKVAGNGYTHPDTLKQYAVRRGKELCATEGYPRVQLTEPKDQVQTEYEPGGAVINTMPADLGGYTTVTQRPGTTWYKHTFSARAVCMTEEEYAKFLEQERQAQAEKDTHLREQLLQQSAPTVEPAQAQPDAGQ